MGVRIKNKNHANGKIGGKVMCRIFTTIINFPNVFIHSPTSIVYDFLPVIRSTMPFNNSNSTYMLSPVSLWHKKPTFAANTIEHEYKE